MRFRLPRWIRAAFLLVVLAGAAWSARYAVHTFRADRLHDRALELMPRAQYDDALTLLLQAADLEPSHPALFREIGRAYLLLDAFRPGRGFGGSAVAAFDRAASSNPLDGTNFNELGWAHLLQRNFSAGEAAFRRALELDPNNVHNLYSLGRLFEAKGDRIAAIEAYEDALAIREYAVVRSSLKRLRDRP